MNKNIFIKTVSAVLAASLLLAASGCAKKPVSDNPVVQNELDGTEYKQQEYSDKAQNLRKNETVYVNLSPDGTVKKVNVTDWLHSDRPQVRAEDVSILNEIQNVKTLVNPIEHGGKLYWDMDTTDIYYSGVTDKQPPIQFNIKYYLEGSELSADEIAGKKGNVTIEITVVNTLKKTVTVMDKSSEIFCPMLAAGGMIMSEDVFSNISVSGGSVLSDGEKQVVFFAGIPGMDESLELSKLDIDAVPKELFGTKYTVTAYTECFEIGNMMFAVLPFSSLGSVGNGELPETVDSVKALLSDIETLETAVKGLDVQRVIDLLYGDSDKIGEVLGAVDEASALYSENEKLLKVLGKYMTEDNLNKLNGLVEELNKTDIEALSETLSDPALQSLLKLLPSLSDNLAGLNELTAKLNDVMPLFESLSKDLEDEEVRASLEELPQTLEKLQSIFNVLKENEELIATVGDFAGEDSLKQIEAIMNTAKKYAGLTALTDSELDLLAGRMKAWLEFGEEYEIFTECTEDTEASVMFTYKTDAISAAAQKAETEKSENTEEKKGVAAWLKNLFS